MKVETINNESHNVDVLEPIYTAIISNIQKSLSKGSDWIIDSVIEHNINISNLNPLAGSSYIKFAKVLDHPRKGLINIWNADDNEFFKCCLVRYLHPEDRRSARITKAIKIFQKDLILKS